MREEIGFIGMGNMGMPMVSNLSQAGRGLIVFDIDPAVSERAEVKTEVRTRQWYDRGVAPAARTGRIRERALESARFQQAQFGDTPFELLRHQHVVPG